MKTLLTGVAATALLMSMQSAYALVADGITYSLTETTTANPLVDRFTLSITGINGGADTEGGRSGVNAIALTKPTGFSSAAMVSPPTGFNFIVGGLNSTGCDGSGNFYCFDNTAIPPTPGTPFATNSSLTFVFDLTLGAGESFAGYSPSFKIDWVGSKNNYDLVSLPISITHVQPPPPPPPPPPPVSEPGSLAMLGTALLGMWYLRRTYQHRG